MHYLARLKILYVYDASSQAFIAQRYLSAEINAIYFSEHNVISRVKNPRFFVMNGLVSQINQIKELSKEYTLFLCYSFVPATICYLAGVNYIIYFGDAYIDPQNRIRRKLSSIIKYSFHALCKDALESATETIASNPHDTQILKKYRPQSKTIVQLVDDEMFNPQVKKIDLGQNKFTFFSPQRIEPDKGQLIMWEAIKLTKSDFVVLQTDYGTGDYYQQALKTKPEKVKIIPLVKRENMPSYFASSDAVLGQISKTTCGSIEKEAILCRIPVFCYSPFSFLDDDPFYKKSTNPQDIADYIDRMVEDKNFRDELARAQSEWIKKAFDNNKTSQQWQQVFDYAITKKPNYKIKLKYVILLKLITILERLLHKDLSSIGKRPRNKTQVS
jgi:glycosyltransferase involved in cell wall biosynthesis